MYSIPIADVPSPSDVLFSATGLASALTAIREHQDYLADDTFPHVEFDLLQENGLLAITLPGHSLDFHCRNTPELLQVLKLVGKGNLSVGRIYEGHINALYLIHLFADEGQQCRWYGDARDAGHLFGVWNTEAKDGIVIREQENGTYRLEGAKTFCSGAKYITRPLITGRRINRSGEDLGWQMCIVPMDNYPDLPVDKSFWKPLGMRASVSHKIDFTGVELELGDLLGQPNEYHHQPYFSGGAIRFSAVHLGGAEAIYDATRHFLRNLNRTEDPYQRMRLGELAILIETGNLWIQRAGEQADERELEPDKVIAYANMTRTKIERVATEVLQLAGHCVGARGLLYPEPFARLHADMTTYLRQPAPDKALAEVGGYVSKPEHMYGNWISKS